MQTIQDTQSQQPFAATLYAIAAPRLNPVPVTIREETDGTFAIIVPLRSQFSESSHQVGGYVSRDEAEQAVQEHPYFVMGGAK